MKRIAGAIACTLTLACAPGAQAAVAVPLSGTFNGLTLTGAGSLAFSADLLSALNANGIQVQGYAGSPTPISDISLGLGGLASPVPLATLLSGSPPPSAAVDTALQSFLQSLQLLSLGTPSSNPGLTELNMMLSGGVTPSIPEPATLPLMGLGVLALELAVARRVRRS